MKKIMILLILMVLLSGCIEEERYYVGQGDENNIIILKPDGTYEWHSNRGYVWTGEYEETEETVLLKLSSPLPSVLFKKIGNNLTYKEYTWTLRSHKQ